MANLYEFYNTNDDSYAYAYGVNWLAQTFTPAVAHKITSVKLLLYREGEPNYITVSIRETDGEGHPTGEDLCSGQIFGNDFTEDTGGIWYEITLGAGYNLEAATKYAIVVRALTGSFLNWVDWREDATSPTYDEGNHEISGNSGSTWTAYLTIDSMFEDWGEEIVVGWQGKISGVTNPAKIMGVAVANIKSVKGVE